MRRALIRLSAPVTCPRCEAAFKAHWTEGAETAAQRCPACRHEFISTWPGFEFRRERVIHSEPARACGLSTPHAHHHWLDGDGAAWCCQGQS